MTELLARVAVWIMVELRMSWNDRAVSQGGYVDWKSSGCHGMTELLARVAMWILVELRMSRNDRAVSQAGCVDFGRAQDVMEWQSC